MTEAVVGRLGGDEFALLLEDRTLPQAIEVAENLRTRLAAQPFDTGKDRITLTWSVGVGEGRPGDTGVLIIARAVAALFRRPQPRGRRSRGNSDTASNRHQRAGSRLVVLIGRRPI